MANNVITALEIQKRNKDRVNVYIDDEFAFGLSLMEAARLRKGQVLSDAEIAALRGEDDVLRAVDSAANFLSYRPRSISEVRRNLKEKEMPPEVIEAAVERLTALGYLDDEAFARFWVQNRSEFKPLSHKALRQELRQKGLADAIIGEALGETSESEMAYQAAIKQSRRLRGQTKAIFKQKLTGFLQRRGFSYTTTRDVIERLIDEFDADDPDYFDQRTDTQHDEE